MMVVGGECIALVLDLGFYFLFRARLKRYKEITSDLKGAPRFENEEELQEAMVQNGAEIPYAVVEGRVTPMEDPITSQYLANENGVVKAFTNVDHETERRNGFWYDKEVIQNTTRDVPIKIVLGKEAALQNAKGSLLFLKSATPGVEVLDLDKLDNNLSEEMNIVYDHFEPSSAGFGKSIFGSARGDVSKGIQETEKMLLVGTKVTAVGRLMMRKAGIIKLMQPANQFEFILTKKSYEDVVRGYEEMGGFMASFALVTKVTAGFLVSLIAYRLFKEWRERREYDSLLRQLSDNRRQETSVDVDGTLPSEDAGSTAQLTGSSVASPAQDCVICLTRPRDVIFFSCGHIAICHECSRMLPGNRCPICCSHIKKVQPFYVA